MSDLRGHWCIRPSAGDAVQAVTEGDLFRLKDSRPSVVSPTAPAGDRRATLPRDTADLIAEIARRDAKQLESWVRRIPPTYVPT